MAKVHCACYTKVRPEGVRGKGSNRWQRQVEWGEAGSGQLCGGRRLRLWAGAGQEKPAGSRRGRVGRCACGGACAASSRQAVPAPSLVRIISQVGGSQSGPAGWHKGVARRKNRSSGTGTPGGLRQTPAAPIPLPPQAATLFAPACKWATGACRSPNPSRVLAHTRAGPIHVPPVSGEPVAGETHTCTASRCADYPSQGGTSRIIVSTPLAPDPKQSHRDNPSSFATWRKEGRPAKGKRKRESSGRPSYIIPNPVTGECPPAPWSCICIKRIVRALLVLPLTIWTHESIVV